MSTLRLLACVVLLGLGPGARCAAAAPTGASEPGPLQFTTENGTQVVIQARPGSRTVFAEIGVRVGSRDEPPEFAGMSHLLEHLLFKEGHQAAGAAPRNPAFSALPAGAEINASTDFELTEYHADLPAERFEEGWRALVAMVTGTGFDQADVERERGVVLQEVALGKTDPLAIMAYAVLRRVFPGDPIGQPVIGFRKTLERITERDLQDYYRRFYVPANMFAVIAGDVDPELAARLVRDTLGRGAVAAPGAAHPPYPEPVARVERRYRFQTLVSQAYLLAGALTAGEGGGDAAALTLLATILGEGKSSRLHRRLVEREALTNELLAISFTVSNAGAFSCGLAVEPARAAAARAALMEELALLAHQPVSDDELVAARMAVRGQLARQLETNAGAARFAARRLLLRQPVDPDDYLARFERLSPADLRATAARTWGRNSGPGPIEIHVLPARGLGKVLAAVKFLLFKRL